jgi:hypothetical protein
MSVIEALLESAYADRELLGTKQVSGDNPQQFRDVDFRFTVTTKEMAETLISLVEDNRYGAVRLAEMGTNYQVIITIYMPITQQVMLSVSGLMACLSKIFAVEYEGWECIGPA